MSLDRLLDSTSTVMSPLLTLYSIAFVCFSLQNIFMSTLRTAKKTRGSYEPILISWAVLLIAALLTSHLLEDKVSD